LEVRNILTKTDAVEGKDLRVKKTLKKHSKEFFFGV
jgi:hypothetical protein